MRCRIVSAVDECQQQREALKALTEEERIQLLTKCRKGRRGPERRRQTVPRPATQPLRMHARSPSVERFVDATNQRVGDGRRETATAVSVGRSTETVGELRRSCTVKTAVRQNTDNRNRNLS